MKKIWWIVIGVFLFIFIVSACTSSKKSAENTSVHQNEIKIAENNTNVNTTPTIQESITPETTQNTNTQPEISIDKEELDKLNSDINNLDVEDLGGLS
ncbi:MAG: hypothetical protein KJ623_00705 [Nanoarchaeota archaeon]|nr:hypothetical protein [Nanoarchaeota archaeon]MBU0963032.1 hypothetical protein [Nanoarchaeota archaeon]